MSFVFLMSGFVAYRSGAFESFIQSGTMDSQQVSEFGNQSMENLHGGPDSNITDTFSVPPRMLSSSKSLILVDPAPLFKSETLMYRSQSMRNTRKDFQTTLDEILLDDIMISSKSSRIFDPVKDSILRINFHQSILDAMKSADSTNKVEADKQTKQNNTTRTDSLDDISPPRKIFMDRSKSGFIYYPDAKPTKKKNK